MLYMQQIKAQVWYLEARQLGNTAEYKRDICAIELLKTKKKNKKKTWPVIKVIANKNV